jgi:hypothetical protein
MKPSAMRLEVAHLEKRQVDSWHFSARVRVEVMQNGWFWTLTAMIELPL